MSTDSMFVHKMWVDHELSKMVDGGVPFPMLSDGGGKVGSVYGVYDEGGGVDVRGRFLIDPDGVVQGFEVLTPPVGRNVMPRPCARSRPSSWCAKARVMCLSA
jgi:alkyl hydroperoxide reductase subunit AhpC